MRNEPPAKLLVRRLTGIAVTFAVSTLIIIILLVAAPLISIVVYPIFAHASEKLPLWCLFAGGTLVVGSVVSLGIIFTIRIVRRLLPLSPKLSRRILVGTAIFMTAYVSLYFGTTSVKRQGHGGLTGPLKVRIFQNETHLIAFYPLYLLERRIRDGSDDDAVYYFNIDFRDEHYPHPWLYGDGIYTDFW